MLYIHDTRTAAICSGVTVAGTRERILPSAHSKLAVTSDLLASNLAMNTCKFYANF
jgi:hypothetical protein